MIVCAITCCERGGLTVCKGEKEGKCYVMQTLVAAESSVRKSKSVTSALGDNCIRVSFR